MIHDSPDGDRELLEKIAKSRPRVEIIRSGMWALKFDRPNYDSSLRWQLWVGPFLVRRCK